MLSKTDHPRLVFSGVLLVAALLLSACMGRKPVVQYAGCGTMPPPERLCLDSLPNNATDADLAKCYAQTVWILLGENAQLRAQYFPCSQGRLP